MDNIQPRHLFRMKEDGTGRQQILPDPVLHLASVSPDGGWAVAPAAHGEASSLVKAYPLHGGAPIVLCDVCPLGFGPTRILAPIVSWSADGKHLYFSLQFAGLHSTKTAVLPLHGAPFNLSPHGVPTETDLQKMFGARILNEKDIFPGPDPDTYVFSRASALTNIYRIILP